MNRLLTIIRDGLASATTLAITAVVFPAMGDERKLIRMEISNISNMINQ
jgi:hypothetical protein